MKRDLLPNADVTSCSGHKTIWMGVVQAGPYKQHHYVQGMGKKLRIQHPQHGNLRSAPSLIITLACPPQPHPHLAAAHARVSDTGMCMQGGRSLS